MRFHLLLYTALSFCYFVHMPCCGQSPSDSSQFDWVIGHWEGTRHSTADDQKAPMSVRVERVLGGAGLAEHLRVTIDDENIYYGYAVQVFDQELKRYARQYINATRGRFVRLEAETIDDNEKTVWNSTRATGRKSRLVSERISSDEWQRTLFYSEDEGKTWQVLWTDRLTRVPDP